MSNGRPHRCKRRGSYSGGTGLALCFQHYHRLKRHGEPLKEQWLICRAILDGEMANVPGEPPNAWERHVQAAGSVYPHVPSWACACDPAIEGKSPGEYVDYATDVVWVHREGAPDPIQTATS